MFPLCSSRIITEEGPVLLAVSLDCRFGKVLSGDQGDFCHPQVTARWTVPSCMYHGCLFCLKFILHRWGLCFMSDPWSWDGTQHPQPGQGSRTGTVEPSSCGAPAPHKGVLACLFCHSLCSWSIWVRTKFVLLHLTKHQLSNLGSHLFPTSVLTAVVPCPWDPESPEEHPD